MNLHATITNFRGVASATLDLSKICLIAGINEAGKTSTAQAVTAALTGEAMPILGVKKAQAGMLVRSGTANGSVDLTGPTGSTNIQYPSAKVKTEGQAPFASQFATGLQTIVNLDDKERVKVLTEYLKAVPTRADLDEQLASLGLPVAVLDQLWKLIETQGWDGTAAQIKDKGARLKGQWENVTADRYGSKKADSWIPEGYDNDLMGQSEDKLKAIVTDARDALEAAIACDAVNDSRKNDLQQLAGLLAERQNSLAEVEARQLDPAIKEQLKQGEDFVSEISENRRILEEQMKELPQPDNTFHLPCPACGAALQLEQGKKLSVVTPMTDAEKNKRMAAIDAMKSQIDSVSKAVAGHMEAVSKIRLKISSFEAEKAREVSEWARLVKQSETAAAELKTMQSETAAADNGASIDNCRTTLAAAETRLKAFTAKHEADRLHDAIQKNADLLAKIVPEGIRGDVLVRALKQFNDSLAKFSTAAGWKPVTLESDFMLTYGGTVYLLLSESAKFRVRVILQIGMALIDKSQALVVDAADILDKGGRNGLFKAVKLSGLSTLVAMTIDSKELVPNLGKAGFGCSYWVAGGVAEAIQ
jgi:hypothetical protein